MNMKPNHVPYTGQTFRIGKPLFRDYVSLHQGASGTVTDVVSGNEFWADFGKYVSIRFSNPREIAEYVVWKK